MTIDERLEALTQSLELLGSLHRDNDRRMGEIMDAMARNEERMARNEKRLEQMMDAMARNEKRLDRNDERMAQMMDAITRLARIADAHQDRLDDHGERLEHLEGGPPRPPEEDRPRRS